MRFLYALVGVLLVAFVLLTAANASATHKHRQCGQHPRKNIHTRKQVVRCWAQKRGLPPRKIVRVARCESGPDLLDDTPGGLYSGTFQHARRYWPDRARAHRVGDYGIRNVWAQARVSTAMMRAGGWGHWPRCQYA